MDNEGDIQAVVDGLLQHVSGVRGRQEKCLRPLVTTLVKGQRPMTALELAEQPGVRQISMTTLYRLIGKLDDAGLLRRFTHRSRADLLVINLPEKRCNYLICSECGGAAELPVSEIQLKMENECTLQTGWGQVKLDVELSGVCPGCLGAE